MANVTITKREDAANAWDVDYDGVRFSVELRPIEQGDPRLAEHPDDTWSARITRLDDGTSESRYGVNRQVAVTKAAAEMKNTRKILAVDWATVMRALDAHGAFR